MSLIPKTAAQKIADRIDSRQQELANHAASVLCSIYEEVNTSGLQQDILDTFGSNAVAALTKYESMRQSLAVVLPEVPVPAPDLNVFQPQLDGTVLYVAPEPPPEPEPAPEPEG